VHPRARKLINEINFLPNPDLHLIDPVGYLEMVALVGAARQVLTDSGGLQKEAYWLGVPCITLRNETEWVETVEAGWNVLVGTEPQRIARTVKSFIPPDARPLLYGDGTAADKCVDLIGLKSEPMALVGRA
jgi:UDP-N-acetylglucosamine 2-epimerase